MVRKLDSNSLTETKNWSGRNEIIETSGRLHPLWPQNKRLNTPWTTDFMHTRQDRWIQTELAFTLAKNVTKPNPFEIIPLLTTRKENNWKTEETLARAVVTLETEWIKGSNSWCLWWWLRYTLHSIIKSEKLKQIKVKKFFQLKSNTAYSTTSSFTAASYAARHCTQPVSIYTQRNLVQVVITILLGTAGGRIPKVLHTVTDSVV